MIEFKEKHLLGGWSIAVIKSGIVQGHIRKHGQDGSFLYFGGQDNILNWSMQDHDLEALKENLISKYK